MHCSERIETFVLANNKAQDVTIKKLTRRNPTMAAKFDELNNQGSSDTE